MVNTELIVNVAVGLLFAISVLVTLLLKRRGDAEFDDYIAALDADVFKMRDYLPIGLYLNEHIDVLRFVPRIFAEPVYRYNSAVAGKVKELYGVRFADFYVDIHNAERWLMVQLGLVGMLAFAAINCVNGEQQSAVMCAVLSPVVAVALAWLQDKELDGKIEDRRNAIMIEFPEFINKLVLLVNAGMTISRAWEKIVTDNKRKSPLYDELNICLADIRAGKPEAVAYEDFARRCKVKEIIKFVSVIILNLKKGGAEVVPALRAQSDECWEMRKATAKRLGEKAASKLMLPMAIMLVGIIMIVVLPAVLSLTAV